MASLLTPLKDATKQNWYQHNETKARVMPY